ncbi:MAG: 1-deoxy-D-xylulose-5-phosphate reductoisomerase [Actinobacteria bacterium]|nr:MAG: 1-deoxy-D-xylulose-5-phosphate reductoisomerase [Actinomycetota bacterium]
MKRVSILGSTGSIGRQAVEIALAYPQEFPVVALSTHGNIELLRQQAIRLRPQAVVVVDEEAAERLRPYLPAGTKLLSGAGPLAEIASLEGVDLVLNAIVGYAGLEASLSALAAGKTLALANKESMVVGGELVLNLLAGGGGTLVPVDSEHSAIFQCLFGERSQDIGRLILTGSGGPFRGRDAASLGHVTVEEALAHPTWSMGPKITIDSATLMNKGLEIIEAHYLFGVGYDDIEVMIHPQSIVHSLVEFVDGSVKAQMGLPDMRLPILLAMTHPARLPASLPRLDLARAGGLTFERPDEQLFPALPLARKAGKKGLTFPAVLNAANEIAVDAFLSRRIGFLDVVKIIEQALDEHAPTAVSSVEQLRAADGWARDKAGRSVDELARQKDSGNG